MLNWKYPAAAVFAVAAIVPSLCQNNRIPLIGRAHANQQTGPQVSASINSAAVQPRAGEGKLMMGQRARALKEVTARKRSERNSGARLD